MIRQMDAFVHRFDKFGQPVASLNIGGRSEYNTRVGGCCGLLIYGLITWFTIVQTIKMVDKKDPTIYQVEQGFDLMANNTPVFNLNDEKFQIGYYAQGYEYKLEDA